MEVSQRASHILLTKYTLLVLCVHLCAALDYYSFYAGLTVKKKDIAKTLPLSTICECHSACKAIINCTAATHVAEDEPKCLISETPEIFKNDLGIGDADVHTTMIKGYQVKFVSEPSLNVSDAKAHCNKWGMRLATPSDAESLELLAKIHKEKYPQGRGDWNYWVDITKTNDNKWMWGDRVEVTAKVGADPWAQGYPNWDWKCGKMSVQDNLRLKNWYCNDIRRFVCTF